MHIDVITSAESSVLRQVRFIGGAVAGFLRESCKGLGAGIVWVRMSEVREL